MRGRVCAARVATLRDARVAVDRASGRSSSPDHRRHDRFFIGRARGVVGRSAKGTEQQEPAEHAIEDRPTHRGRAVGLHLRRIADVTRPADEHERTPTERRRRDERDHLLHRATHDDVRTSPPSLEYVPNDRLTRIIWQTMITTATVRKLALGLPQAVESSHFDVVDFRVRKKIFATIHPSGKTGVLLRLDPDQRAALAANDPETFQLRGTALQITFARITRAQYKELVTSAWAGTAPKRLVAQHAAQLR
jgi:hypothetical protein